MLYVHLIVLALDFYFILFCNLCMLVSRSLLRTGDCKTRNETKQNKTSRNETKRDTTETKQDKAETKRNETKRDTTGAKRNQKNHQ